MGHKKYVTKDDLKKSLCDMTVYYSIVARRKGLKDRRILSYYSFTVIFIVFCPLLGAVEVLKNTTSLCDIS